MTYRIRFTALALTIAAIAAPLSAQGGNPTITMNENGVGSILFPGGGPVNMPGAVIGDPCNGGLPALTYNLLGPPALVPGDLLITEVPGGPISDWIRFNPAGACGAVGYPASVVFYSDNGDGADALADQFPFPVVQGDQLFGNGAQPGQPIDNAAFLFLVETGPEGGPNGVVYIPGVDQPGYVPGFSVTYVIQSDLPGTVTPEPATLLMMGSGLVTMAGAAVRRRRRS